MHFHPTARKLYLNKLTLTVCLRNARTTYFIFRNDYLQPFQEGLKEEKEKKNPKQPEDKAIPVASGFFFLFLLSALPGKVVSSRF